MNYSQAIATCASSTTTALGVWWVGTARRCDWEESVAEVNRSFSIETVIMRALSKQKSEHLSEYSRGSNKSDDRKTVNRVSPYDTCIYVYVKPLSGVV